MVKLAIVDDHQLFLEGLKEMLDSEVDIQVVFTAMTGLDTINLVKSNAIDIVLLDISLPDIDGIELCKTIKDDYTDVKIIALTMHKEVSFLKQMIENGANGYLLKNAKKEELIRAIKTVVDGESYFSEEITRDLYNSMIKGEKLKEDAPKLSRREKEILTLIIEEYTTQEIADKLFITPSTVESHRANLLAKLDVRNAAGLVRVTLEKKLLD